MTRTGKTLSLAAILLAAALPAAAGAPKPTGDPGAKWFVLRTETGGNCWTGLLISASGQYVRGGAQLAGGPYDTRAQAEARLARLQAMASCK